MTEIEQRIRHELQDYRIRSLMENVLPHKNIKQQFHTITHTDGEHNRLWLTHPMDKSYPDTDYGGTASIGTQQPSASLVKLLSHYTGHTTMTMNNYTPPRYIDPTIGPHQRLGDPSSPLSMPTLSLPYNTSAHRPWPTTTETPPSR